MLPALILPFLAVATQTDAERATAQCASVNSAMEQAMAWQGLGHTSMADDYTVEASVSAAEPWCMGWTVVSIAHRRPGGDAKAGEWVVRLARGAAEMHGRIAWAEERDCPAVLDAIEALTRIKLTIGFSAPVRPSDKLPQLFPPLMDGPYYTVRSNFARQPDGALLQLEAMGNTGAIRAWYEKTMRSLSSCWRSVEPSR